MNHPDRVDQYLSHIIKAIDKILIHVKDIKGIEDFMSNDLVHDAVVRNIMIIGEAAAKINHSDVKFIRQYPAIPWAAMRSMRNVLVHNYDDVEPAVVWKTVQNDLPGLKKQLADLLADRQKNQ